MRVFTIIKLVVASAVVGSLATIVIVAYNEIVQKAAFTILQSDFSNARTGS